MAGPSAAACAARAGALTRPSGGAGAARFFPAKRAIGWAAIVAVSAFFLIDSALPYLSWSERAYGGFWPRAPWLLAHVIGGSIALLFGPWQFWTALAKPSRSLHRRTGRFYLGGVLLAGASALYLGLHTAPAAFGAALLGLDSAWLTCTMMGWLAVRSGRIARHREWMIRSYVLTLAFVSFRLWLLLAMRLDLGDPAVVVTTVGWASWVLPLLAVEAVLRRRRAGPARPSTSGAGISRP